MLLRWRFRRPDASADAGVLAWSFVAQGTADGAHVGDANATEGVDTGAAAGAVLVSGAGAIGEGADIGSGAGSSPLVVIPVLPTQQGGGPDEGYRYWWSPRRNRKAEEERLRRMRAEIGLLPPETRKTVERTADRAVEKAVVALSEKPATVKSETHAFDLVASYQREYQRAFQGVLAKARAEDADAAFRAAVKTKLAAEHARKIALDDEDIMSLVERLL